jgi:hypothetical protein
MSRLFALVSLSLSVVVGCGGPADPAATSPDGSLTTPLDPASCAAFAQSAVTASTTCGTPLPGNAAATLESYCRKGVAAAAMCGGMPAAGLGCFATPDATDWTCALGSAYPACNGDAAAALGAYCLIALGNPRCASGIHCDFDVDCSGNGACNSATHQCFDKAAYCIGLPCGFDVDCPSNETCNSAEHACVGR